MDGIKIVTWDQLPEVQCKHVTYLDERELCLKVNAYAHGGAAPDVLRDICTCPSYAAGNCKRAGAFEPCAFHDPDFDWRKARDWAALPEGGMLYDPKPVRPARRNGKTATAASPKRETQP